MRNEKIKLFYCVTFMVLMKPYIFNEFYYTDLVLNAIKVILFFYLLHSWIIKKKKGSKFTYFSFAFVGLITFSTIIHNGSIFNAISISLPIISIVLFLDLYINDLISIISSFQRMIELFTIINLISIFTIGVHSNELTLYFLGSKNGLTIIVPLYILITIIYSSIFPQKRNRSIIVNILLVISVVMTQSTTMIIELIVFLVLYILRYNQKIKIILNYWTLFGFYIVANLILLFSPYIDFLLNFLDIYLSKGGDSLKIRILMWIRALEILPGHLFFGIGKWTEKQWRQWFYEFPYKAQLHNEIIEFLILGGIVLLFIYMYICIMVGRKISSHNSNTIAYTVTIACFLAYISVLTSAIYNAEFFMILGLGYYIKNVITVINPGVK